MFLRDLRSGFQQMIRRPGFSAAAIASLALGVGLNTTLFSVVNAVLLRDSAIAQPERLVEMYTGLNEEYPHLTTSYPDFLDLRGGGVDALSGIAANAYVRGILSTRDRSALVTGEAVSANYFDLLGIQPRLGRPFRDDEDTPGGTPVVVVSHGLWQGRLGGRASVAGDTLKLSSVVYTIVGVAPPGFTGTLPGIPTDFWVPVTMVERLTFSGVQTVADVDPGKTRLEQRGTRWLFLKGRLAEGRTAADAQAQVDTVFARLRVDYPLTNERVTGSVLPASGIRFHPMLDGYVRAASAALLAAVGLVLLIACANVANMLLARGAARRREMAIRAAVGASRSRIIRQLLSEGLVLAGASGGLGVLIAWWAGRALSGFGTDVFPMPIHFDFSIDATVLAFASGTSVATALLFGVAPALSSSRPELVPALKDSITTRGRHRVALGDVLVVGQLALSLVLLVAGALLARGLLTHDTDLGFDPRPVSSLSFNLQMNGYDVDRAMALRDRALQAIRALPGVTSASTASRLPLAPDINVNGVLVPGRHSPRDEGVPTDTVSAGAGYFDTVGVPIVAGRGFTEEEEGQKRLVAVVNETMARRYWPEGGAIGRLIHVNGFTQPPHEVIGVARDHKVRSVGEDPRPYLHLPAVPSHSVNLVVRTATPASSALPMLRQAVWALEPEVLFTEDVPAEQVAETTLAPTRIGALVLAAFGSLALLLAAVGLYGVISYSVSRRSREVGIRMALGARRGQVLRMILLQGARLAAIGVALGALASAGAAQVLTSLPYGVSGLDPVAYGGAAGVLLLVALAANLVPAFAAARVDPARAVSTE